MVAVVLQPDCPARVAAGSSDAAVGSAGPHRQDMLCAGGQVRHPGHHGSARPGQHVEPPATVGAGHHGTFHAKHVQSFPTLSASFKDIQGFAAAFLTQAGVPQETNAGLFQQGKHVRLLGLSKDNVQPPQPPDWSQSRFRGFSHVSSTLS